MSRTGKKRPDSSGEERAIELVSTVEALLSVSCNTIWVNHTLYE